MIGQHASRPAALLVIVLALFPLAAAGQDTDAQAGPAAAGVADGAPSVSVPITSGDLARIRRALDADPALRIDDDQLRFYVQILATRPSFAEYAKGYDSLRGPTRGGNPMTHDEFLAMVTPKELQSSVGITARETLEFALTNWLAQTLVRKAFEDLQQARTRQEIEAIRDRIDRELELINPSTAPK